MNYSIRLAIFIFLLFTNIANASSNFVGIIGAAIGEIKNQNNEKLANGSKIFFGDTTVSYTHLTLPTKLSV